MSNETESIKSVARKVYDAFNAKDAQVLDALLAHDFRDHTSSNAQREGVGGIKDAWSFLFERYPNIQAVVDDMLAEGDRVATRVTLQGLSSSNGNAANKTQSQPQTMMEFMRIRDGKVVELWNLLSSAPTHDAQTQR